MKNLNKNYQKVNDLLAHCLQVLIVIALGLLGILIAILIFRELYVLFQAIFATSIADRNAKIMDDIIVFFLFFEFEEMIIAALKNNGHTSISFLMGLGITALLRGLITAHTNMMEVIGSAIAILILIIGMVGYNKYFKES
ncbi:phosphate-starvation-inducible protein PsiE [Lactobacillus agrestimuris]|uniref:phosphate-starvation-inducible protein PsiE n=1 Tax=Lactobacillus agrestimuris TaxID=2941328 RepID=UPI00204311D6|nr:phosphate-starvation-inducible protein PsiE [Lactobacillus agrestimuris]